MLKRLRASVLFLFLSVVSSLICVSQQSRTPVLPQEVRAVWITTASSLDWPKSTEPQRQRQELITLLDNLQSANFNTVVFQTRARGDAYYRSRFEPWAENLTGTLGRDPGWDPLAFLIEEAHRRFMEVHAWFNVYKIRGRTPVGPSTPEHPVRAYPSWTVEVDGEAWFDPGIPQVRTYLLEVALDLVREYDLDGINFDFLRYPGRDFPDAGTFSRYGRGKNLDDWRRENITRFVREFYAQATSAKPWLKVGSSPLGIYREDNANNRGSYHAVYQDSYGWLRDGIHDYLSPQVYWTIRPTSSTSPDFAVVLRRWKRWPTLRHIYPGIAAYRPEIESDLVPYIDSTRVLGFAGQVFFRLENLRDFTALGGRYARPAVPPVMPWKDGVPPLPPSGVTVTRSAGSVYRIAWNPPGPARDGGTAWAYNIYRWPTPAIRFEDPASLIARVRGTRTEYLDTVQAATPLPYTYAVTAIDRIGLESPPSSSVQAPSVRDSATTPAVPASFSIALANDTGLPVATSYTLGGTSAVTLDILRTGTKDTLHAPLVRATQQEGTYRVPLDGIAFPPGTYLFRLQAGENVLEQTVLVGRVTPDDLLRR